MTATEDLRRMLDERGVEYEGGERSVRWRDRNGVMMQAFPLANGELGMDVWSCTPEQAIAATLGRGTCQQEEHGWSTEGDHARVWLTCGHDCMVETVADLPNFCPECGAEVVAE